MAAESVWTGGGCDAFASSSWHFGHPWRSDFVSPSSSSSRTLRSPSPSLRCSSWLCDILRVRPSLPPFFLPFPHLALPPSAFPIEKD